MPAKNEPPPPEFRFVDTAEALDDVAGKLVRARAVAVDTEADSMHSFFEKVCLVQLATDAGEAFIVDPLALDGMTSLEACLGDAGVTKIFHGADFDVSSLKRDYGFEIRGIFDTMVASMLLGDDKLSLRDLVDRFFGVQLKKAYTRCDWGRRPLEPAQLAYSYHDVAFLVELMAIQAERLRDADLEEEAAIEFERLSRREASRREFSPHGWRKIRGSRDLEPAQQAVLAELYKVREDHGRKLDRPVFKVIGNETLLRIARSMPDDGGGLRGLKGVSGYAGGRMSRDVLAAVRRGKARGSAPRPPPARGDETKRLGMAGQKRLGRLRDWRNAAAKKSQRTTLAVLPNYAMFEVARARPRTLEALSAIEGVGEKRAHEWGEDILRLLS